MLLDKLLYKCETRDDWKEIILELSSLEKIYERRQDNLTFMSTHFYPAEFLTVQLLYLEIRRMFRYTNQLNIGKDVSDKDLPTIIAARKNEVDLKIKPFQKTIYNTYNNLELDPLPEEITNRLNGGSR